MTDDELAAYLEPLAPTQVDGIRAVRDLIHRLDPGLVESVIDGKWLTGLIGYYAADDTFIYAVGPRGTDRVTLHLMPYYGSAKLQRDHGPALKPFLTGKSCLEFKRFADLPRPALEAIVNAGSSAVLASKSSRDASEHRKRENTAKT